LIEMNMILFYNKKNKKIIITVIYLFYLFI